MALSDAPRTPPPEPPLSADDEALLATDVEIEPDIRRSILVLFRSLEDWDHYALLGVDPSADKKALKRAYYDRAARFHPDRYFRKRLGDYKPRLEAIFSKMTLAHETLGDAQKRAEYDAYLEERRRSRGIEDLLKDALAEIGRAEERADREARAAEPGALSTPPPVATPPAPAPAVNVNVQMSARRDALARRLLGGPRTSSSANIPAVRPSSPGMPAAPKPTTEDAMDALRRRYDERRRSARAAQARDYVARGRKALAEGDAVGASSSFQIALGLSPDDPELQAAARQAQQQAGAVLAETYSRQAAYEEKSGQWVEAARSWARVCTAAPDRADAHERGAAALVKAGGNMHEAVRLGKRAVELEPSSVAARVTLASAYLAAGLPLNAKRELDTGAQLAPHDGTIQAMLRRVGQPR